MNAITELHTITDALTEEKLFDRAVSDAIAALMRRAALNRSLVDATVQLDLWRQQFERARP